MDWYLHVHILKINSFTFFEVYLLGYFDKWTTHETVYILYNYEYRYIYIPLDRD